MNEIVSCTITVNEENKIIIINNLIDKDFKVDFSSDIDFTELVSLLTEKIDTVKQIDISISEEPTDEKIKLVTDTIQEIFRLYNQSMVEEKTRDMVVDDEI